MTKYSDGERCVKCGNFPTMIRLKGKPEYVYEFLDITCWCGHNWQRLPLDAKDA